MEISTSGCGKISFSSKGVYKFNQGIYGFSRWKKYIFLKLCEDGPFLWLQSVEIPHLAFLLIKPLIFFQDHRTDLSRNELEEIKKSDIKNAEIYVMLKTQFESKQIQVNLLAPIIVNPPEKIRKTGNSQEF